MSENNASINTNAEDLQKIDILSFIYDMLHRLKRFWWLVILLTAGFAALNYYRVKTNYTPTYVAECTVTVQVVNGGTYANRNTADQMGSVFPYILSSGILNNVVAEDLGMKTVPGTIRVSTITDTNLMTISVTSWNAQYAYDILQSVRNNYSEVAQFVVGQTELTTIDDSGVPVDTGRESVLRGSWVKGGIVGFVLGLLFLAIYAASFRTIRNEQELRQVLNVNYLGTLPYWRRKKRTKSNRTDINIILDTEASSYIEAMRLIRTRLERQMEDKKVLMVTSSIPGEGKSTVAANLAISMARKGHRVILVDCDLRKPSQARIFETGVRRESLGNLLRGKCKLQDALVDIEDHGKPTGLSVLVGSEKESHSVELLGTEVMSNLLDELRLMADVVILDTPPSALLVDAMMLIHHVDGVAYVVMSDFARRRYIIKGVEELTSGGAPVLGCIMNGGRTHSSHYGYYGKRYGYGYGYSSYGSYGAYGSESSKNK